MSDERTAFLKALEQDPDDNVTRLVFADWLEEHDEPEEADRMRRWKASKQWMLDWVRGINYGRWQYGDDDEPLYDQDGQRIPATKDNLGDPHTYEDAIQAGKDMARGEGSYWGTDAGADYFRESEDNVREWFSHWSTITGVKPDNIDTIIEDRPVRCAC